MKILITGANGFIGRHVVVKVLEQGYEVVALMREGTALNVSSSGNLHEVFADLDTVRLDTLKECDVLIHLAAFGVHHGINDWTNCFKVNVIESLELWTRCVEAGIKRFIICGSGFEYGKAGERYDCIPVEAPLEPTGAYHASKAAASMAAIGLAFDKSLKMSILRPFQVFGEGESEYRFWASMKKAAQSGADFSMTLGEQIRYFTPVELVARQFVEEITNNSVREGVPEIKNIGGGRAMSLGEFARDWWRVFNATGIIRFGDVQYRKNEIMRYVPKLTD